MRRPHEEVRMAAARRGVLKVMALLPVAPSALLAGQSAATRPASAAAGAPPEVAVPSSTVDCVADALAQAVRCEHGDRLDAEGLARVRRKIAQGLEAGARLRRAARLRNADEPVTLFHALPAEQRKRR
jgi:hypothetical protein